MFADSLSMDLQSLIKLSNISRTPNLELPLKSTTQPLFQQTEAKKLC